MFKRIAIAAAVAAALTGCGTEDRPYDKFERPAEEISTASLDTESLWLFMPSTGAAPRYAMTQRGFFQGDPKLVTLRFDEFNGIYAEEVDRDKLSMDGESRWDSDINKAPVLKIPGEFREYRCALNAYDECTNKEEINKDEDREWTDATHFVPDYEKVATLAHDSLTWYTASNVEETAEPRIVSYEYNAEEGVINVELERTFTADPEDQYQFGNDPKNLSFKTRFFYSLVKLDKLVTPDYQPIYYQGRDRAFYGFFEDSKEQRTATGETNVQGSVFSLLNRFAPNQDSIDYYLSDSYHDEGNELYKRVTMESIADINKSLEGTGVPPIRIVNPDSKAGVHTGDLRYNVLNLITDPVDNGLLGYGPSATNPLTGEIVHAHVNQYAGVIRGATRAMWTQLVMRYNRQEIARPDEYKPETQEPADTNTEENLEVKAFRDMLAADMGAPIGVPELADSEIAQVAGSTMDTQLAGHNHAAEKTWNTQHKDLAIQSFNKHQQYLDMLAEQNAYAVEFMWLSTQSKGLIEGIDYLEGGYFANEENTELKAWDDLTAAQQSEVSDAIAAHMFRSTLIHELGHNLGLRHNFMGSVDKANFYSEAEAKAKGMEKVPAYSSIMDYAASIFDELPTYGKYDIAALRFGYGRQVEADLSTTAIDEETNQPKTTTEKKYLSLAKLDSELAEDFNAYPRGIVQQIRDNYLESDELKNIDLGDNQTLGLTLYNFCTDEHTTTSVLCNRFDEGTNIKELTDFRIQRYYDSYDTMNRRNGRQSFYQFHQYNYFLSRWDQFLNIRDVIENVEEIDYLFARYLGVSNTNGRVFSEIYANSCRGVPRDTMTSNLRNLCDTYDAAVTAADFFIDVMTQPDKVCELEEIAPGVPNRYRFATLSDLWRTYGPGMSDNRDIPTSCYDDELVEVLANQQNKIVVRSETRDGRIQASLQANNPHQSSVASVDLLGAWPDKLLAAQMLVRRDSPFVDTENSSLALIDIEGKVEDIYSHLSYLAGNPTARQPVFVDKDGEYVETVDRYVPSLGKMIDQSPSYLWPMKHFFGFTDQDYYDLWYDPATPDTPTPEFRALLNNLHRYAWAKEYGLSDNALGLIDAIGLRRAGPYVDTEGAITFSWKADNFVATRRNLLAQAMATRALYGDEQKPQVERLGGVGYRVRNALNVFRAARDHHEARLIAIADADALKLMQETTGFARFFLLRNNFKEYEIVRNQGQDNETTFKCRRLELDSETEAQRLNRKCNSQESLENALQSIDRIDDARLTEIYNLATTFGDAIESNNQYSTYRKDAEVYDYDPQLLRLWSTNEYVDYRRAFEQFPLFN
ncbi:zinc-dependent metalloprotease [Ferrimonas sp. YFM]|uniref:zinc-dependent metalloprotease n=1 Tax=Ferrimonas sp. YFM TaxID=3028878 RepID=UPI0025723BEF|nr:zinc-dependent metalloprotease [Ferrimonas sp. YFM]BDY03797.1 hypothetical protein F0521_08380 [Ferrimonas sp. YFM]